MDEAVDNHEESVPKRSRSDDDIKAGKETSSSDDSEQQSPHKKHYRLGAEQNLSACNNSSDNVKNNNQFNINSDSGLCLKMEDSSCGDAEIAEENGILKYENDNDVIMAVIPFVDGKQAELDHQQMSTNDSTISNEEIATVSAKEKPTASGTTTSEIDKPTTSSSSIHIKRHKPNRSRNYRGRSSSFSSESSQKDLNESQLKQAATYETSGESPEMTSIADTPLTADSKVDEEFSSIRGQLESLTNVPLDFSESSLSLDSSVKSDDINFKPKPQLAGNEEQRVEVANSQELEGNPESTNPATDTPSSTNNNETEDSSNMRRHLSLPSMLPEFSSESSLSSDSSSNSDDDDDDDDTDFVPSLLDDLTHDDVSNDSEYSNLLKEKDKEVDEVLKKQKPPYTWCESYELMRREHGLSGDGRTSLRNGWPYGFRNRFYASRQNVERMKISHVLRKHSGCVNCLNFNKSGDLLVTGSDDARLIVWDWAANKTRHVWKSGHSANIFQSKFLPSSSHIDIISAGRDGKVRRSVVPPSGGKVQVSNLYLHSGAVHKLVICPENPSEIISVGEDGLICSKDLREDNPKVDMLKVVSNKRNNRKVRLFSISHHPFAPEICVSGSDQYVRVYDKRLMKDAVHLMSPEHILKTNVTTNVTCCVYNNSGTEILATYSEDNIYLFNNKNYIPGEYLHSYRGHFNQKTIKGVNFFGPNCEYVISGSDCSNIFFWDKNTEAILNFMPGDTAGVVNCLEPHPTTPILATSGLDHNIKIWTPSAEKYPPDLSKLNSCVQRNIRRRVINYNIDLDRQHFQSLIQHIMGSSRVRRRRNRNGSDGESGDSSDSSEPNIHSDNDDYDDNSADDELDDDNVDVRNRRRLTCGTQ